MSEFKKILITTGGTGGHVFPAYALGKFFQKNNIDTTITTDKRGYDFLRHYKDIKIEIIDTDTIFKKNLLIKIISFLKICYAILYSIFFIIKQKPKVIIGMGGYSSFPICIAATILKIPFTLYENNLYLGKANRYLLPYAKLLFCSYSEIDGVNEKYKDKIFEIGNILRDEIINYENITDTKNNFKDELNILILGGSQAAKVFAEKLPKIFHKLKDDGCNIMIYQQCMPQQEKDLQKKYNELNLNFETFGFSYNLTKYFSKVNLAITRSGSSMLAELLNCNIPIISIPLPTSAENHQLKNAKYFKNKGYGFLVEEHEIDSKLLPLIKSIYQDKDLLNQTLKNQKKFNKIDSKLKIYKKINSFVK